MKVSTGGDQSHMRARSAYEKAGFVPLPVVNYFGNRGAPASIGTMRSANSEFQTHPRLIIVCGLPGSGRTSHAKEIEQDLSAVRLCADEWADAMGINLWEGETRQRIGQLQWKAAQQILTAGGIIVIEWGIWARSERDVLRKGREDWRLQSNSTSSMLPSTSCSIGFGGGTRKGRLPIPG
jgi:hypothetical protein